MMRHHKPSKFQPPQDAAAVRQRLILASRYRGWANAYRHTRPFEARVWAEKAERLEKGLR